MATGRQRTYVYDAIGRLTSFTNVRNQELIYSVAMITRLISTCWLVGQAGPNASITRFSAKSNLSGVAPEPIKSSAGASDFLSRFASAVLLYRVQKEKREDLSKYNQTLKSSLFLLISYWWKGDHFRHPSRKTRVSVNKSELLSHLILLIRIQNQKISALCGSLETLI